MGEKSQKQKQARNDAIYLFEYRNDLLFFIYDHEHPKRVDLEQFHIGKFRLFRKDKIYSAELRSKPFLNPAITWNAETFQLMLQRLNDFVCEEENFDFSGWLFLCVHIKVKGKQINLLKIRLSQEFGIQAQNELWNEFKRLNNYKTKFLRQTSQNIQTLEGKISTTLDKVQQTQQLQIKKVQETKKKLSALMYEKEKKIMELTGNHLYKWAPQQRIQNLNDKINQKLLRIQPSQINFMSSQDDRMLVGSLFAPSQQFLI